MSQFNQAPLIAKSIPNLLKSQNTWVVWKYGPANLQGKRPKIPLSPKTLSNANALDPVNHLSFGEALTIYLEKKSDGWTSPALLDSYALPICNASNTIGLS
jgi:hypothetical protein